MTTIAWDLEKDLQIVSDGLGVSGSEIQSRDLKKYTQTHGCICFASGVHCLLEPLTQWWLAGAKPDQCPKTSDESRTLFLAFQKKDGVWVGTLYGTDLPYPQKLKPREAWGSGESYASAALHLGHTPLEAVQTAAHLDVYTGGLLRAIDLRTLNETQHSSVSGAVS